MKWLTTLVVTVAVCLGSVPAMGQINLDGIVGDGLGGSADGLTLRATQDTYTGFGNNTVADQTSNGGSELNQLFANIDNTNGVLEFGFTGNLKNDYNKLFIFFDAVPGGENQLANDNADGGFGEINALAGLGFPSGVTMDHGLRLEVGGELTMGGFLGVRYMDLIDNVGGDIFTGNGPDSLPLTNQTGNQGVSFAWNNGNVDGVNEVDATGATTATLGFEASIDLETFFGNTQGNIAMTVLIANAGSDFVSNQALPGIGGGDNIGGNAASTVLGTVVIPGQPLFKLGDVDNSGTVDLADFDYISENWLTQDPLGDPLPRILGNLDADSIVGIKDFREWKNAYLAEGGSLSSVEAAFASLGGVVVPEPGSIVLLAGAALALAALRRRMA